MILIALAAAVQVPSCDYWTPINLACRLDDPRAETWISPCTGRSPSCTFEEDEPKLTFKQWQLIFEEMREMRKAEYLRWLGEESLHPDCLSLRQLYGGC